MFDQPDAVEENATKYLKVSLHFLRVTSSRYFKAAYLGSITLLNFSGSEPSNGPSCKTWNVMSIQHLSIQQNLECYEHTVSFHTANPGMS